MSKNNTGLTREQLVSEFVEAVNKKQVFTEDERREPHTWTSPEIRKRYKLSRRRARAVLDDLVDKKVIYTKQVWRIDDWGFKAHVKGYKLNEELIAEVELVTENNDEEN